MECVVQAEVLKKYQGIEDIEKMPDLLFHLPDSERNLCVAEIKMASNSRGEFEDDLDKLVLFQRRLDYETLVEIVIGTEEELAGVRGWMNDWDGEDGTRIDLVYLSVDESHEIDLKFIKYRSDNGGAESVADCSAASD